jgi:hypothetical protein
MPSVYACYALVTLGYFCQWTTVIARLYFSDGNPFRDLPCHLVSQVEKRRR